MGNSVEKPNTKKRIAMNKLKTHLDKMSEIIESDEFKEKMRVKRDTDKNCLSYWYPYLRELDIQTPKTTILKTELELIHLCDGKFPDGFGDFIKALQAAIKSMGLPVFLRTGQTSGKHDWIDTCYVNTLKSDELTTHVYRLVEFSACADILGLWTNVWVVRELLKTEPAFLAFRQMPITKEFRYFVKDGKIVHRQPYWPEKAIEGHCTERDWKKKLKDMSILDLETDDHLSRESIAIGLGLGGYWSIDWLLAKDGWYCIDMALGDNSYVYQPPDWFLKKSGG